ncbi:BREX system Lon protease-like protein BrxL [Rhodococcus opacus]|uniref:BREX system Lon protease-like protein BrxL n=1 Tax=Rhodococcus opacus TaxID=37919 RepID=UPI000AC8A456|nr:BREX system Lon protease-like protein BrxL [Rhodococcus opacus]
MLKHSELPESYHDSAYLDRLHFYIPGWEVDTIRGEIFSSGYGFVVDYIAEVLKSMRNRDYSYRYQRYFTLGSDISTRDGIHKTFSGLMKLLYPHEQASAEEIEEILRFAIEGRKRVKDQILRLDDTMVAVKFGYQSLAGEWTAVTTLDEDEYPGHYHRGRRGAAGEDEEPADPVGPTPDAAGSEAAVVPVPVKEELFQGQRDFVENQRGISFETLLMPYLRARLSSCRTCEA